MTTRAKTQLRRLAGPPLARLGPAARAWCVVAAACAAIVSGLRHGPWTAAPVAVLGGAGTWAGVIDARTLRLPDRITGLLAVAGVTLLAVASVGAGDGRAWPRAAAGALASGVVFVALAAARPGALGLGDVKLGAVLGAYLAWFGWGCWAWGVALAFILGGLWALGLVVARGARRTTPVPFGPFLVAGALVAILSG